jgi:uncharacterized membrane protein
MKPKYNIYLAGLAAVVVLLSLDAIYLLIVSTFYKRSIKRIQNGLDMKVDIVAAVACYIFMIVGLVFIVFTQLSRYGSLRSLSIVNKLKYAVRFGGIVGLVVYGVFNTTNLAIFRNYSKALAIIDMFWGTIVYTLATFTYLALS